VKPRTKRMWLLFFFYMNVCGYLARDVLERRAMRSEYYDFGLPGGFRDRCGVASTWRLLCMHTCMYARVGASSFGGGTLHSESSQAMIVDRVAN
jgi:hypothetical protein